MPGETIRSCATPRHQGRFRQGKQEAAAQADGTSQDSWKRRTLGELIPV